MRSIFEKKNNKGQIDTVILTVITIFIIGIVFFFMNHVNDKLYDKFEGYMEGSEYNNTEAEKALNDIGDVEESSIWDYAFLAIYFGLVIQMVIFSFATRINIVFYWIFALEALIILILGVVLSNTWQSFSANPEFTTTLSRFPIMNLFLGSYMPIIVTFIMFVLMIILFGGKPPNQ